MTTEPELLNERLERLAMVLDKIMPNCALLVRDALELLKEQEAKTITNKWHKNPLGDYSRLHCPWCDRELDIQSAKEYVACPYCGKAVKWE